MNKKTALLSAIIYALYAFLIKNHVSNIFSDEVSHKKIMYASIVLSAVFGFFVVCFFFTCIRLLIKKNSIFLSYMKQFLIYFVPLFLLLILTWPGIFKGDDFYVLKAVRSYSLSPAQTGITSLFYICCLRFFPSMAGITFFQILIISCIYAYIFKNLKDIYPDCHFILCRIVLFLFPVLDACLFTLRATLTGFFFLLILSCCYFIWKKEQTNLKQIFFLCALTGLVIAWRSELVYMLLFLPIYIVLIYKKFADGQQAQAFAGQCKKGLIRFLLCFIITVGFYSFFNIPNKIALNGSNKYPISLVINPLGNIFAQDEIRGEHAYDDIMIISELLDVQALRKHPSVRNISQYWNIPDTLPKKQLNAFMNASVDLILHNFDSFLYYRYQTFRYTNGMVRDEINHPTPPTTDTIYTLTYYDEDYHNSYYYMKPLFGEALRNRIIDLLSCRHYEKDKANTNALYPVLYNCLPTFFIALTCMIICLIRKRYAMAGILFMSGVQLVLIFLTAPAIFFMYYFCFYLTGYFLSALSIYELCPGLTKKLNL